MKKIETNTAAKLAALRTNAQPAPSAAMSRPAAAGPIMRAMLNDAEFKDTALPR